MSEKERKEFIDLLLKSTLFPENGKKVLMAAFFNKTMSEDEAQGLLEVLREEVVEMKKIDDAFAQKEKELKETYQL